MAIIPESYCLARINAQSTREVAASLCGLSVVSDSSSGSSLLSVKTPPVSYHSSLSSTRYTAGREIQAGAGSIAGWGQQGQRGHSWGNTCKPARGIKINREPLKVEEDEDDDPELCSVDCVREFKSRSEFDEILQYAKEENALVVVDFFKTACGSCRYIEKGFAKLCKGAGNTDVTVIFLKHNVMDEYEEQSEVAEEFKIRVVPLFHFYKNGELVESFPTREKTKILEAICKHTGLHMEDVAIPRGV